MQISDKVAIVTGSSKGIGLSTVQKLLSQGMTVVGWSRSETKVDHKNFYWISCDVGDPEAVDTALEQTRKALSGKKVSVLVNNAGLAFYEKLTDTSRDHWHTMMNVNVNGVFYCTQAVLNDMIDQEEGHIINIASVAATVGVPNMTGYATSKWAVRGFSRSLFMEVREKGVKVTCIYPGSVQTSFFDDLNMQTSPNMMSPEDIALTIQQVLESSTNFHHVDIEVRPLKPKG